MEVMLSLQPADTSSYAITADSLVGNIGFEPMTFSTSRRHSPSELIAHITAIILEVAMLVKRLGQGSDGGELGKFKRRLWRVRVDWRREI